MVDSLILDRQLSRFGRIGVLYGGASSEREISLMSGEAVYRALKHSGLEVILIDVKSDLLEVLPELELDQVFIALHGLGGEDGTLQGALEYLQLPYTGSGVLASSLAMDKRRCKQLWQGIQLPTAEFCLLEKNTDWESVLHCLGGSAIVKPASEGSSIGMSRVESASQLKEAWKLANDFDAVVIAEPLLTGDEYTVAILGSEALPSIRIRTPEIFYDYKAKYFSDETQYFCPSGLSIKKENELRDLAMKAFNSLNCRGWGRVDVMTDDQGRFQILEVNTVPGLTSHSLVPIAAQAAGINFNTLVLEILRSAL
jgi:D-alanine-D-alanine ligase